MIDRVRYIWQLLVLLSLFLLSGILLHLKLQIDLPLNQYLITLVSVGLINLAWYLIMKAGIGKNNREGVIYLMGGIGAKFLLYLLFILLFWVATKNLSKAFILTFFVLYLVFTFFTAGHLLKTLKNK